MELDIMEYIGKYYSLFVNKNYNTLKDFYNENEEHFIQNHITFPVYCFFEFRLKKDEMLKVQDDETKGHIFRTPTEELLTQYPIK